MSMGWHRIIPPPQSRRLRPKCLSALLWSSGLDRGTFSSALADRYQKGLPIAKELRPEVLVAYTMQGEPLTEERGRPVWLVVPGCFGTNSTKWLCRLEVRLARAPEPYTTAFLNERDTDGQVVRPVWEVEVNSMIVNPSPGQLVRRTSVPVHG